MSETKGSTASECLQLTAELMQRYKQRTYALMRVGPGHRILDVGCGSGTDTVPLAHLVGSSGQVLGIDYDEQEIVKADQAAEQAGVSGWVVHKHGDATSLPFESGWFDSTRSERVFQYLPDPERALSEMVRVTKSDGWIVVLDTDWGSLSVDTPEFETEQKLKRFLAGGLRHNPLSGRHLYRLFRQQNLLEISIDMCPLYVTDYALGREGASFDRLERNALATGAVTQGELDRWRKSLERADAQGVVFGSFNQILVAGRKP
jgi:ubiquinone/menaquinone biosynthesis C-methylase UbiE